MSASVALAPGAFVGPPYPNLNPLLRSCSSHAELGAGDKTANSVPVSMRIELDFFRRRAMVLGLRGLHSPPPPRDNLLNLCIAKDR